MVWPANSQFVLSDDRDHARPAPPAPSILMDSFHDKSCGVISSYSFANLLLLVELHHFKQESKCWWPRGCTDSSEGNQMSDRKIRFVRAVRVFALILAAILMASV